MLRSILGLLILKNTWARRGNFHPKKDKILPQILPLLSKSKKKRRKRESSTDSSSSRDVSPEVALHSAKIRKYGKKRRLHDTSITSDSSLSDGSDSDES